MIFFANLVFIKWMLAIYAQRNQRCSHFSLAVSEQSKNVIQQKIKKNHISIFFFQDVDLKKAHEELKQLGLAQESTVPSSPPPIATKNIRGRPARPTEHSPIKPQKNKPGPKPKLKG